MSLMEQLSDLGLGILLTLGLTTAVHVEFSPPVVQPIEISAAGNVLAIEETAFSTRLHGTVTQDILNLLAQSVEIGIQFTIDQYDMQNRRITKNVTHTLVWRSLDRSLIVSTPEGIIAFRNESQNDSVDAFGYFETVHVRIKRSNLRFMVVKAKLVIPALRDPHLVARLWNNQNPSVTWEPQK